MSYVALYRKFRPVEFDEVKGQDHIVTTLKNQIKTNRIGHAYLFCGTRGTGKTTVAKIFARAVNCESPVEGSPCGECELCKKIKAGTVMNVREIDGASNNGVDDIRKIVEEVEYPPTEGKYTVYIIDEAHMVTTQAFNALLKTLEEPPSYVIFIFATTDPSRILTTIHSRCQRYDFRRIALDTISDQILELTGREGVEIEETAARYIAKVADGSMRDALSLLDQCIAFHFGEKLTYDNTLDILGAVDSTVFSALLEAVLDLKITEAIQVLDEVVTQGRDLYQFVNDFIWYLRNLLLVKSAEVSSEVLEVSRDTLERLKTEGERVEIGTVIRFINIFSELSNQIRYSNQKRILIEVAIIKLCKPQMEVSKEAILDRIRELEDKMEKGIPVYGVNVANPVADGEKKTIIPSRPTYPKAVPEEYLFLSNNWESIAETAESPSLKVILKSCRATAEENNDKLIIVADNEIRANFLREEHMAELQELLNEAVQKEVDFEIRSLKPGQAFEEIYVDLNKDRSRRLSEINGVPVKVAEEGEDHFDDMEDYDDSDDEEDSMEEDIDAVTYKEEEANREDVAGNAAVNEENAAGTIVDDEAEDDEEEDEDDEEEEDYKDLDDSDD